MLRHGPERGVRAASCKTAARGLGLLGGLLAFAIPIVTLSFLVTTSDASRMWRLLTGAEFVTADVALAILRERLLELSPTARPRRVLPTLG
jgi:hypothetical protein